MFESVLYGARSSPTRLPPGASQEVQSKSRMPGNPHVRFDERGRENGASPTACDRPYMLSAGAVAEIRLPADADLRRKRQNEFDSSAFPSHPCVANTNAACEPCRNLTSPEALKGIDRWLVLVEIRQAIRVVTNPQTCAAFITIPLASSGRVRLRVFPKFSRTAARRTRCFMGFGD